MKKYLKIIHPKFSIRARLLILFVVQVVIIFSVAGFYLQWRLRNTLEEELGKHLETVANLISLRMEGEILNSILPGDERTRSYRNIVNMLHTTKIATGVRRIFIFDRNYKSLADTEKEIPIGWEYIHLKFDQKELTSVFKGKTASSVLFTGVDGRLYKSGYAPIFHEGRILAVVRVDGSAKTLKAIEKMRRNLLTLGILAILGSVVLAIFFSNRITNPLKSLQKSATEIGHGNYQKPIKFKGQDEVGFLSRTLEEMRKNIIQRDIQQKAMLAGVAHEIRNPLGGIELFAGILADELRSGEERNQLLKILKEVKNLKTIVQNFLDYARPAQPQKQACSPKQIFDETINLLAKEQNQIQIKFEEKPEGLNAFFDPQHLKQIFINLTQNAIQALPDGGTIKVKIKQGANNNLEIRFADNGIGIRENDMEKIFDPFFTTRDTGVGLGLAIVKSLVEANGGQIELIKNVNKGTMFQIILPHV